MTRTAHIQPNATCGRPQRSGYIHHSKILRCSVFDVQCSVFSSSYTFSAKERDLETGYSYFGARYYDAGLSVWLSVDPMADKYPSLSPYQYCALNPIIIIDPRGDTIRLAAGQREEFINAYNNAIDALISTPRGLELYNNLQNSEQVFIVREWQTGDDYENFFRSNNNGGTIVWNLTGGQIPLQRDLRSSISSLQYSGLFGLIHEMAHAEDHHFGRLTTLLSNTSWNNSGLNEAEWSACHTENIIRGQMGVFLRTHYYRTETGSAMPALIRWRPNGFESIYKPGYFYRTF